MDDRATIAHLGSFNAERLGLTVDAFAGGALRVDGEVALTSAYVVQRSEGEFVTWNCRLTETIGRLFIYPYEDIVTHVHFNVKHRKAATVCFSYGDVSTDIMDLQWVEKNA